MNDSQSEFTNKLNAYSAGFAEFVSRVMIERTFFQNNQIPQETLLYLANDLINALRSEKSVKMNVAQELLITYKQIRGQPLTEEEQQYENADRDIDVIGEVLNGVRYSTMAFLGKNFFNSVVATLKQKMWQHLPVITAYTGAVLFGPQLIRSAVDNVLYYSDLSSEQKNRLKPWLNSIGRLALGFMPKVHATDAGVHYHYPSRTSHTETHNRMQSVSMVGEDITLKKYGRMQTPAGEFDAEYVAQFKLQSINHISEQLIKIQVVNQSGVKTPVEFHIHQGDYGPEIEVKSTDANLVAHWSSYFRTSQQPVLPFASTANENRAQLVNVYEQHFIRPALMDYLPQVQINYGQILTTALALQLGYQKSGRFAPALLMAANMPLAFAMPKQSTFFKNPAEWDALKKRIQDALEKGDLNSIDMSDLIIFGMHAALAGKGKEVVVFFGPTGSGKSASIDFLMGIKLNLVKNAKGKWVVDVDPSERQKVIAEIGNYLASQTFAPGIFTDGINTFGDLPGSLGNRGVNTSIAEAISTKMLFDNIDKAKIVLCVSYTSFDDARGNTLRDTVMKFATLLPSYTEHPESILFVVTRAKDAVTNEPLTSKEIQQQLKEFAASTKIAEEKKMFQFLSRDEQHIKICNKIWDVGPAETAIRQDILSTLKAMPWIANTKGITNVPYSNKDKLELTMKFNNIASAGDRLIANVHAAQIKQGEVVVRSVLPLSFFKKSGGKYQQPHLKIKDVIDSHERIISNNRAKMHKLNSIDLTNSMNHHDEYAVSVIVNEIEALAESIYNIQKFITKATADYLVLNEINESLDKLKNEFDKMQADFDYLINFNELTSDSSFSDSEIIKRFLDQHSKFNF
ncbi:MAG: hypothetical protein M3R00_00200 [Pseudomonadota bacterium]|nr:hypothetical protein [Pseudomonadota bacterium]